MRGSATAVLILWCFTSLLNSATAGTKGWVATKPRITPNDQQSFGSHIPLVDHRLLKGKKGSDKGYHKSSYSYSDKSSSSSKSGKGKKEKGKKSSKKSKGKGGKDKDGKGKGGKGKGGKGKGSYLPDICEDFNFLPEEDAMAKHTRGGKKRGHGYHGYRQRALQFEGEGCDTNVFDTARENPNLTTFVMLVEAAGIEEVFRCAGPFTLLAPSNTAFNDLDEDLIASLLDPENVEALQDVLIYHVVPGFVPSSSLEEGDVMSLGGGEVTVGLDPISFNGVNVIMADMMSCNGVIHVVESVLMPGIGLDSCSNFEFGTPFDMAMMGTEDGQRLLQYDGEDCETNFLETARADPELSTFVSLVEQAGLANVFSCAGPFTGLIPSNDAFGSLDPEEVAFLTNPTNVESLRMVLLYHLLPGVTLSMDMIVVQGDNTVEIPSFSAASTPTLEGNDVMVAVEPLQFNGVDVERTDILACNGVIHVVDEVLIMIESRQTLMPTPTPGMTPPSGPTPTGPTPSGPTPTGPTPTSPTSPTPAVPVTTPPTTADQATPVPTPLPTLPPSAAIDNGSGGGPQSVPFSRLDFEFKFFGDVDPRAATTAEYNQLIVSTEEVLTAELDSEFADFESVTLTIVQESFDAEREFQIQTSFDAVLFFAEGATVPTNAELLAFFQQIETAGLIDVLSLLDQSVVWFDIEDAQYSVGSTDARSANVGDRTPIYPNDGSSPGDGSSSFGMISAAGAAALVVAFAGVYLYRRQTEEDDEFDKESVFDVGSPTVAETTAETTQDDTGIYLAPTDMSSDDEYER